MASPKQDSNRTGLSIAEEVSPKVLPGENGEDAVWYAQEPNSYSDFGGELTLVAREPINPSRQRQKGGVTDLDASGGFNQDFTKSNFQRLLQGFMFADARQKARTNRLDVSSVVPVTSIAAGVVTFSAALAKPVLEGALVVLAGFASPLNSGLKLVTAGGDDEIEIAASANDAAPAIGASLAVCGHQFDAGDISLTLTDGVCRFVSASFDLRTLGLTPGEWIFVGGDSLVSRIDNNVGYARVKEISQTSLVFDKISWNAFTANAGAAKTVQIFFGTVIRNEKDVTLIKRRTYSIERSLGSDDNGQQAEYLDGAVPNELTLNIPQAAKLEADLSFVAIDNRQRDGSEGLRPGSRVAALGEPLYNTSSNVYRQRMSLVDPSNPNPVPFFAYMTDGNIAINNGITPDKAVGVLGAFDVSADDFVVSGEVNAYFSTVQAIQAIRNNRDVTVDGIFAAANAGFVYDIPLLALGGGRLAVEKGQSIKVPLEMSAAENTFGYTLMFCFFDYLPNVAMPV